MVVIEISNKSNVRVVREEKQAMNNEIIDKLNNIEKSQQEIKEMILNISLENEKLNSELLDMLQKEVCRWKQCFQMYLN